MFIALYLLAKSVLPQIGAYARELINPIMVIIITLSGIIMLFGAVGMKISNNLGSTIVGGIFRAIGYIAKTIVRAFGWLIRNIITLIPRVFNGSKRIFNQMGLNSVVSNILAIIVTAIILAIII